MIRASLSSTNKAMELALYYTQLKELGERVNALRGYL